MIPCIILDIDGTLADGAHRLHLIQGGVKRWDDYFDACFGDKPIEHMLKVVQSLEQSFVTVFVSGRAERCRAETEKWLSLHGFYTGRYPLKLYMRADGDHRNDDVIKIELLGQLRAEGYEPIMAFDDRNRVVKAWRVAGIPCAQVADGDF